MIRNLLVILIAEKSTSKYVCGNQNPAARLPITKISESSDEGSENNKTDLKTGLHATKAVLRYWLCLVKQYCKCHTDPE